METEDELTWAPAWKLRELVAAKQVSPVELTRHFLARIEDLEPTLHAFITVAADDAIEQARRAEDAAVRGEELGPLHGVPIAIKDQFWTRGIRTTGGSLVFDDYVPQEDSVHAERVRRAGAVIVGKTNTPEFGMFGRTVNRITEETRNPWDTSRTSGGSSGGSASAVAAGMVPLAIGSDGGGSLRLPAAYCGVFGLHPSDGRVPRHGSFGGALFTSGVGPVSRNVRDGATLFQVLAGPDDRDPTCMPDTPPDYQGQLGDGVGGMRIAWTSDYGYGDFASGDPEFLDTARAAALCFGELGAKVEEITLGLRDADTAWRLVSGADRYASLGERLHGDPATRAQLTPYVEAMFSASRAITGAEYSRAMRMRYESIARMRRLFEEYDLIVTPTTLLPPSEVTPKPAALTQPQAHGYTRYTRLINFTGLTAASVPCGFVRGLPVGLHVIGKPNGEAGVLRACRALEEIAPWTDRHPALP